MNGYKDFGNMRTLNFIIEYRNGFKHVVSYQTGPYNKIDKKFGLQDMFDKWQKEKSIPLEGITVRMEV